MAMDSFDQMMKAASHIKSYQMSFDKKLFERLPEFYKTGLYCCEMTKNIRNQKSFYLKCTAFDILKNKGIDYLSSNNYSDAHYAFCKSLCIFKYIKNKNKNWKNEGVKDEDLEYCEDKGENSEEEQEIKKMKISALLNIALCDLNSGKFQEVRLACDEVLKLDPRNVKAFYRKAKSYLDCKSSIHEDHILALQEIESALKIDSSNESLLSIHGSLKNEIDKHKQGERKVFKSFFRNVNYEYLEKERLNEIKDERNKLDSLLKSSEEETNLGKPEIRILNLIIEQCLVLIERLERDGDKHEMKKMQTIVEKAKIYKDDLQKLLELNFDQPNEDLKNFAEKNNLNLSDPNVKNEFFKIRKDYIAQINKFYEENLLKVDPRDIIKHSENLNKPKSKDKGVSIGQISTNKFNNINKNSINKKNKQSKISQSDYKEKNSGKKTFNYSLFITGFIFLVCIFILTYW